MEEITTDYLVTGAGAMGMAFTDVLLSETDATVTLVDEHAAPGGHWNDAYPYVRLHQPSSFYGVNSTPLGSGVIDQVGTNKGLYELATGSEVVAYFRQVLDQTFLPSGRVRYLPMSRHDGNGTVESLMGGAATTVRADTIVDASYMKVEVPAHRLPPYTVADGVTCIPPNGLPKVATAPPGFVVIGAGKTGADACLWLLQHGVEPERISWVMPRDSWYLNRAAIQPATLFGETAGGFAAQFKAIAASDSVDDMFARLEDNGSLMRLDPDVTPTMYRCSTVTVTELNMLRTISSVIRLGRVRSIEPTELLLDEGAVSVEPGTVFVDCTADGLARRPTVPVFAGNRIVLQTVRHCQQVFSAAFIGHIEASYDDEATKNELCTVVPHPDSATDFMSTLLGSMMNAVRWGADPELADWLLHARLDWSSTPDADPADTDAAASAVLEFGPAAVEKLGAYLAT